MKSATKPIEDLIIALRSDTLLSEADVTLELAELASLYRVTPALGMKLVASGSSLPPVSFAKFLANQNLQPAASVLAATAIHLDRNKDLLQQYRTAQRILAREQIVITPLKGIAILIDEPNFARELTDIDILLNNANHAAKAQKALIRAGWRETTDTEYSQETVLKDTHQMRPLLIDGRPGSIELHRSVLQSEYEPLFSAAFTKQQTLPATTGTGSAQYGGAGNYRQNFSAQDLTYFGQALHTVLHSGVTDKAVYRYNIPLRAVLDLAWLIDRDPQVLPKLLNWRGSANAEFTDEVQQALDVHLHILSLLRPDMKIATTEFAQTWWQRALQLSDKPLLHKVAASASMVPFAIQKERMEARSGKNLDKQAALLGERAKFIAKRVGKFIRERR